MTQPTNDLLDREVPELVFTVLSTLYLRGITGTSPATRSYSLQQLGAATGIKRRSVLRRILIALFRRGFVTIDQPRFDPTCDNYRFTIAVGTRQHPAFKEQFDAFIAVRGFVNAG